MTTSGVGQMPAKKGTRAENASLKQDVAMILRGVCMGGADVVPGISGGTVALILGIYTRWVTAISRLDGTTAGLAWKWQFRQAAQRCDLRFLVGLGIGVVTGIGLMTFAMNKLLTTDFTRSITLAAFFGMILASGILVAKLITFRGWQQVPQLSALGFAGAALAWWLTTLNHNATSDPSLLYLFFCGSVAICAMVLPGISGAMILLVLGVYEYMTELLKDLPHRLLSGEGLWEALLTIVVFFSGCVISLLAFSRVLRWLLGKHQVPTMAVLCGFIFGALPKIWPYQRDLTPQIEKFRNKSFETYWPDFASPQTWTIALVAVVAFAAVMLVHRLVHGPTAQQIQTSES